MRLAAGTAPVAFVLKPHPARPLHSQVPIEEKAKELEALSEDRAEKLNRVKIIEKEKDPLEVRGRARTPPPSRSVRRVAHTSALTRSWSHLLTAAGKEERGDRVPAAGERARSAQGDVDPDQDV